nr:reverse transcriptase domain-containing protein [Tanacetum cinerariifolium]
MSTRSTSSNLFSPFRDPESLIRRRNLGEPTSFFDFKEVMSIPYNNQGPPPARPPPPQNNNGPPPMVRPTGPAPRSMEELCQPSINGRGGPIAPIPIQATNFRLLHHMIQQVQNSCQFHGLLDDDANRHIDKFLEITQYMKQNGVFDDALHLSLFLYSLMYHATAWYDCLSRNSIHTFDDTMRKFLSKYIPPSMVTKLRNEITDFRQKLNESLFEAWEHYKLSSDLCPNHNILLVTQIDMFYNDLTLRHRDTINAAARETFTQKTPEECYELIKNMTAHHNHWDTSATQDETSRTISSTTTIESPKVIRQLDLLNKNFQEMMKQLQSVKSVDTKCKTCGGPHSYTECPTIDGYTQEAAYATTGNYNSGGNSYQPQGYNQNRGNNFNKGNNNYQALNNQVQVQPSKLSNYMKINKTNMRAMQNQITNIRNDFETSMKEKNQNELQNMMSSFLQMQMQSPSGSGSLPSNTVANLRSDLKAITTRSGVAYDGPTIPPTPSSLLKEVERKTEATKDRCKLQTNPNSSIPYPSRLNDQKLREKANNQMMKFLQIFQRLNFDISFADALLHMPKFASTFKSHPSNKEKLFELASTPLNDNCSAVLLKKLHEKLGDPGKFLISCDFSELEECLALADLGASINLMALSIW